MIYFDTIELREILKALKYAKHMQQELREAPETVPLDKIFLDIKFIEYSQIIHKFEKMIHETRNNNTSSGLGIGYI